MKRARRRERRETDAAEGGWGRGDEGEMGQKLAKKEMEKPIMHIRISHTLRTLRGCLHLFL